MHPFDTLENKKIYWHSTSHILAQAIKRLYPETKLAIGPAIDEGFYYDFDKEGGFCAEDLKKIEEEMQKICKENLPIERIEVTREEAIALMEERQEPYKLEIIRDLPVDAPLSCYKQGEFVDLCLGPHVPTTGEIKAFKLLQIAGAYWRGNEKNRMLTRIYGVSFPSKDALKEHLTRLEEAKKRDHNKIGRELGYFTTVDIIGQGLPLLMPKGATLYQTLTRFVEDEEIRRGYKYTKTPLFAKSDLYKISGHWQHYRDGMFIMGDPEEKDGKETFALRPMTCPFQYQIYMAEPKSYRDLPYRLAETSTLFRNESSGEMHGLIRLRQFTISEAHIMVTPAQVEEEFRNVLDLIQYMMRCFGIENEVTYRLSKWDPSNTEKYIGTAEQWESIQDEMRNILLRLGLNFVEAEGEAAFYGPKLDIQFKNVYGKEDTLITVQIDIHLAKQFGMEYVDSDGTKKNPYIIHRTSVGCYERTMALLLEKYAGALPLWLAPEQLRLIPISEQHIATCEAYAEEARKYGLRVSVDKRDEKMGKKIRQAQMEKIPYMGVVGSQETEDGTLALRSRKEGEQGTLPLQEAIFKLVKEDKDKVL